MSKPDVIWSPVAELTYSQVLEYLNEYWTIKEIAAFIKRTDEVIGHIVNNPLLYPRSARSDVHKCVVVKQVSLFYRVTSGNIELLMFWDNRLDPNKLKF
ncbi:hypothetical protein LX99_03368 [Mucilaginibacter oryzae]|uniref:Plasmid stabilization system protein ParE n=1 Tax=Mucilaginibacter oryzae TaxID=468058 RepID=A0A316HNM7_9SPHI|nr:hypothetical protein [Mucilaginibacter oryzae]PWK76502.1 hypothetical protein LX99_03368 [Mucilaginibacter oryzae]